jgi:hypothetical protein
MADGTPPEVRLPRGLRGATLADLWLLCRNMRQEEIDQYLAFSFQSEFDYERAAVNFYNRGGIRFAHCDERNVALCVGGYEEVAPGVWQSWMVGSPETWAAHWLTVTKRSRWVIDFMFREVGARRLQTNGLADRRAACVWYERGLKMRLESVWEQFGKNGEDVAAYRLLRHEWEARHGR